MKASTIQPYKIPAGLTAAGIAHGATGAEVLFKNVEVTNPDSGGRSRGASSRREVVFCFTGGYRRLTADTQPGDGGNIPPNVRVNVQYGKRLPKPGKYDAVLRTVNNNGSLDVEIVQWRRANTSQPVDDRQFEPLEEPVGAV